MRARSSFWAQLGQETFAGSDQLVQQIREAMLASLQEHGALAQEGPLRRDLVAARDLAELWYLRPRLMQAFAHAPDRVGAEKTLHGITEMFNGHFGSAISSRFGSL